MSEGEPLVVPAIFLSDNVVREWGTGKLYLIGVFAQWNCPRFPFQTPSFWITAFMANFRAPENTEYNITTNVEQVGSGQILGSTSAKIRFNQAATPDKMLEIPFRMHTIILQQQCSIRVVVLANEERIGERVFAVNSLTSPSTTIG